MNSTLDMESECSTIESLTSESWLTEKLTTLEVKSFISGILFGLTNLLKNCTTLEVKILTPARNKDCKCERLGCVHILWMSQSL